MENNLNLTYYKGEDFYSEGCIEDQLLKIVKKNDASEFDAIIEKSNSWSLLYHLSTCRGNIVNWYPFQGKESILEVGAGCGAISGFLASRCHDISCVDLSKRRSEINATRNIQHKNMEFYVGNWEDIEPNLPKEYDIITFIGVLEYAACYINSPTPYHDMLLRALKHLRPNGKILIAIENRLGLKYWAGCMEDHVSKFFEGIEGYPNTDTVKTFSKKEMEALLKECSLDYKFYYPYPDYKFMTDIYSDEYLPDKGSLTNNLRNFDQDRMILFDESKVFDTLIDNDLFPQFSNSFFIEAIRKGE